VISLLLFLAQTQDALPEHPADISTPALRSYSARAPKRASLPGRAELLVIEDDSLPLVDGTFIFRVGSVFDPPEKAGLAALAADCMRGGGSKTSSSAALDAWLDLRAATFEILPAEETLTLRFSCASEDLSELLKRVVDLMRNPAFSPNALASGKLRARTLVTREEDDAGAFAHTLLLEAAYGAASPWARRPTAATIDAIRREDLIEWHAAHIVPNRLVVGVTGDVSAVPLAEEFTVLFESWEEVLPDFPTVPAPVFNVPAKTTIHLFDRPDLTQTKLRFAGPGILHLHPDDAPLLLWSDVVGSGGRTNRMMVQLRTKLGLTYSVGAYFRPGWGHWGRLIGFIDTRNEAAGTALATMVDVLRESTDPFEAAVFSDALERHRNAEMFRIDTPHKVLDRAMLLILHKYPEDFWDKSWGRLATLDTEDVAAAVRRHMDTERLVVVAVGPAEELEPQLKEFGEVIRLDRDPGAGDPTEWLTRLFDAVGSRTRWERASGVEYVSEISSPSVGTPTIRSHTWLSFEDASFHAQTRVADSEATTIINPHGGWSRRGATVTEFPPEICERTRARARVNLYRILHLLAMEGAEDLSLDETGRLSGTLPNGERFSMELGENGRPASLTILSGGDEMTTRYSGWIEGDEVSFAAHSTSTEDPPVKRSFSGFVLHEDLDSKLFERP